MYGKLIDGVIKWHNGKKIDIIGGVIINPTIETLNEHGIYAVRNIEEDGNDHLDGNEIMHYVGAPVEPEPEGDETQEV